MTEDTNDQLSCINKTPLINRRAVRQMALDICASSRPKFTRVGSEFLVRCQDHLAAFVRNEIHRHPSVGVTLK